MTAQLLDGKALAKEFQAETAQQVAEFTARSGVRPGLAVVLVGDNPASEVYVRNKRRACEKAGIESRLVRLSADTSTAALVDAVDALNRDAAVHGILVQLPLPSQIEPRAVLAAIDPLKDVDAFHPENVGLLVQGRPRFCPCTPLGIQRMLVHQRVPIAGRHAVIVGRSEIVGKPLALLLMQRGEGGDATVTVCHSRTDNLAEVTRSADVLIAAVGRPKFITADMIQPGAVVVDVGINRTDDGLVGDVDFTPACEVASRITPVPGGVGPLTISMLLENCLVAARLQGA